MASDRRDFLQKLGLGSTTLGLQAALPLSSFAANTDSEKGAEDGQVLFIGENIAVANTASGKVRNYNSPGNSHLPRHSLRSGHLRRKPLYAS